MLRRLKRSERLDRNCRVFHVIRTFSQKRSFFWDYQHYRFFMGTLLEYLEKVGGKLMYFCVMPTHYHLVIYIQDYETLSEVMRHVNLSLSKHLYHKEKVAGAVWKGKLWSRGICNDKDLFDTMKYIHDNPEKAHIDQAEKYQKGSAYECASYYKLGCYTDRPFLEKFSGKTLTEIRQMMRPPRSIFESRLDKEFATMSMEAMYRKYFINPATKNPRRRS